jgi:hypothetical protein
VFNVKKAFAVAIVLLIVILALAPALSNVEAQTYYSYTFHGPYWDTGYIASGNTILCQVLWMNSTAWSFSLNADNITYPDTLSFASSSKISQISWNDSSTLNFTRRIVFPNTTTTANELLRITNPTSPAAIYVFPVTDFFGMINPFLRVSHSDNGINDLYLVEQVDLSAAGTPSFVMQQYQTYTLTFICSQGTYSQQFTAENTFTNTLAVLSGMFPTANVTQPTAFVERINSTLVGVSYIDPSNTTSGGSVLISHQSGLLTVSDYVNSNLGNITTILWNVATAGVSYNVNVTATVNGVTYIWMLVAPEEASANPWLGVFDFLGQNTATMPHVQTGWPEGMTSAQIGEIIGACVVMLFLCIGSFRSAGACCMLSWIIFGILIYMGWIGVVTPYMIPQFAFSGFIGILIMLDEAKSVARET